MGGSLETHLTVEGSRSKHLSGAGHGAGARCRAVVWASAISSPGTGDGSVTGLTVKFPMLVIVVPSKSLILLFPWK